MILKIRVPTIPIAQPRQRHRVARGKGGKTFVHNYTPVRDPVNAFKAVVQLAASEAYDGPPLDEPIWLGILCVMPRPKSRIWKTREMPREPHVSRPDRDNLAKAVKDALTGFVWRDDSLIFDGPVIKMIAAGHEQPHVQLVIRTGGEIPEISTDFV